ncbi:hypothetical protein PTTG_01453 [Puccinia triticina 1-1 BBBD Race 1]|uniref:Uncharacterized protein n=1 Tax=Puccinia triticina (isolate 1-1 / race 1 (BBBD)) TaxID=630390 RepID=A0A180H5I8_PUCT1|nr:hypothetical protein PTTG_01453 [Puccinia triticina 1-1 BBBD Race 1]WAR60379.1 hypothetical protein PtB15_9B318 [Puccinia triticina]
MMAHPAIRTPALSTDSRGESSTRRLRTRAPRNSVLSQVSFDEMEYFTPPRDGPRSDRRPNQSPSKAMSADTPEENSMSIDPVLPPISKSVRRLKISRHHRIPTPPPIPSPKLPYLRAEKFPAWLLGDAMAKSSPKYMAQRDQDGPPPSPFSSQPQNMQTSPVRRSTSSFLGTSPLKHHHFHNSLSRRSSNTHLDFKRPSLGRSVSPDDALDRRRERFWELYEYDSTSPHLQPRYFDKPLPTNEQWADLDIQNIGIIPEPQPRPPLPHLVEVFQPTPIEPVDPIPSPDTLAQIQLNSQSLQNNAAQLQQRMAIPFGFNFLPPDYSGHKK